MSPNDGNVAFKCTWNDARFKGICSRTAYDYNISKNRVWCRKATCRSFNGRPNEQNHPCYESILFSEWRYGAGWDHRKIERARMINYARIGKLALLTTVEPHEEEKNRKIIGFLKISKIDKGELQETIVYGDKVLSLEIDQDVEMRFWDFYKNRNAPTRCAWNTGLFRYIDDQTILEFLKNLRGKYSENGLSSEILSKINQNISAYETSRSVTPALTIMAKEKGVCLRCGHQNLQYARFCNNCGHPLGEKCSECETQNFPESLYCLACGVQLSEAGQINQTAIRDRLLEFGRDQLSRPRSWMFTNNREADKLVRQDPNAFLFAVLLDQGIDAERAWAVPHELKRRIGHLDPSLITKMSPAEIERHFEREPKLHRFWKTMARRIHEASALINARYDGSARNIWPDEINSRDLYARFIEFEGIGQKKASMTVNILSRDLKVTIRDKSGIDVSYDEMVRRTFLRLGLAKRDTMQDVIGAARRLNPEYPGELDYPAWVVGRTWCLPVNLRCNECVMVDVCPKKGI